MSVTVSGRGASAVRERIERELSNAGMTVGDSDAVAAIEGEVGRAGRRRWGARMRLTVRGSEQLSETITHRRRQSLARLVGRWTRNEDDTRQADDACNECLPTNDFTQDLESFAVFGQGTWNISEAWNATLGLRWTEDKKDADYVAETFNVAASVFAANEEALGLERDDSKTTWFANLNWHVTEDIMLFATASTGYKSGGFNSQSGGATPLGERRIFAPEEVTNYELGIKSTLLDGSMTANASLYRMDIEDFQDRAFDGLSFVVVNAGELRQQGLELDLNWTPIEQLRLVAGVAYLDSEYLDFEGAPPLPGGEGQDLTGERRNFSPEWQTSLTGDWTQTLASGMQWFVGGSWSWFDEQNAGTSSNANPQSEQDSYSIVNARVGLRSASGNWDVTLFGNNLTDEDYCTTIFEQAFGEPLGAYDYVNNTTVMRCNLGAPTTWALRGTFRF